MFNFKLICHDWRPKKKDIFGGNKSCFQVIKRCTKVEKSDFKLFFRLLQYQVPAMTATATGTGEAQFVPVAVVALVT